MFTENNCLVPAVGGTQPGRNIQLAESEIRRLCLVCWGIFLEQPMLLELKTPLKICGEQYSTAVTG